MKERAHSIALRLFVFCQLVPIAWGLTPAEIMRANAGATVYLAVKTEQGTRDSGTGFVVSHDGYIITAGHLKADPTERMIAVVGQREGLSFNLTFIGIDEQADIALWRLPQSLSCRNSVTLGSGELKVFDRLLVLGFPGTSGLTPTATSVANLFGDRGFIQTDGNLEGGNSGGPALNEAGQVVGLVQGGRAVGAKENSMVPIGPVIALLRKHSVKIAVDRPEPFPIECYASCRQAANGVESWQKVDPWKKDSGWMGGGNTQGDVCNGLKAATVANQADIELEITGMSEDSKKDVFGHVEYQYHCSGVLKSQPVFKEARSSACGLWN
jgi:hypothetical protein